MDSAFAIASGGLIILPQYWIVSPSSSSLLFIDRNVISEQREQEKKNTAVKLQKYTANRYKSTISQDNNHQAKFKLTQEKK